MPSEEHTEHRGGTGALRPRIAPPIGASNLARLRRVQPSDALEQQLIVLRREAAAPASPERVDLSLRRRDLAQRIAAPSGKRRRCAPAPPARMTTGDSIQGSLLSVEPIVCPVAARVAASFTKVWAIAMFA